LLLAKVNFTLSPGTDSLIIYPAFTAHKKSSKSDSKLKFTNFAENFLQNDCKIPKLNSANAAFSVRLFANEAVPG